MNKEFIIFDFDGTLVDSMKYWDSLAEDYLKSLGITRNLETLKKEIQTMTLSQSANYFKEKFKIKDSIQKIYGDMVQIINNHYIYDIALKEGVSEYLKKLYKKNVKMCIASSSEKILIEKAIQRLEVEKYFEFIITCGEIGFGKDKPNIYKACADKFKAKYRDIAVYEDSLFALETAKKAGFFTVGVKDIWQEKDFDQIKKISDEIISDFKIESSYL